MSRKKIKFINFLIFKIILYIIIPSFFAGMLILLTITQTLKDNIKDIFVLKLENISDKSASILKTKKELLNKSIKLFLNHPEAVRQLYFYSYQEKTLLRLFIIQNDKVLFKFSRIRYFPDEEILKNRFDNQEITFIRGIPYIKKIETRKNGIKIVYYFDILKCIREFLKEIYPFNIYVFDSKKRLLFANAPISFNSFKFQEDTLIKNKSHFIFGKFFPQFESYLFLSVNKRYFKKQYYQFYKPVLILFSIFMFLEFLFIIYLSRTLLRPFEKFSLALLKLKGNDLLDEEKYSNIYEFDKYLEEYADVLNELRESKLNMVRILNTVEDGIYFVDKNYNVKFINNSEKNISKVTDYEGKKCYEVFANSDKPCKNCTFVNENISDKLTAQLIDMSLFRNKKDPRKYAKITSYRLKSDFLIVIHDLTETMMLIKNLEYEKDKLTQIIEQIEEAIMLLDLSKKIQIFNKAAKNLIKKDLENKHIDDILMLETENSHTKSVFEITDFSKRYKIAGQEIYVELHLSELFYNSKGSGFLLVIRDVTKHVQREREELKKNKLESIGVLAGGIAHDFNNILAAASNYLYVLDMQSSSDSSDILQHLHEILEKGKNIANQLFALSKGDTGDFQRIQLVKIIRAAARISLSGSKTTIEVNGDTELTVLGEEIQLMQVFQNLFINSKEAMNNEGCIHVTIKKEYVSKDYLKLVKGEYAKIEVADSGVGIESKNLDKIFDPYFSTKERGSGLGLYIVYNILKKHNGDIFVRSKQGEGTVFTLYIPLAPEEKQDTKIKILSEQKTEAKTIKKILVMDDDFFVRDSMKILLESLGHQVKTCTKGEEAVEILKNEQFDIVFADITIKGGMGAVDFIQICKKNKIDLKVVVMSGYTEDDALTNYQKYGFVATLKKPINMENLTEILKSL